MQSNDNPIAPGGTEPTGDSDHRRNRMIIHWFVLAFILLLALWVRMDDLVAWSRQPQRAFYNGRPILINFDGYFYLSLARDLMQHDYKPLDPLRGVPDPQPRPWPPPMLSMLAAGAATVSRLPLDWIGILLPPLLGLLLAWPLYLLGRLFGGRPMALVATAVGLCSQYYVYRSNLGWFDTDCLNVTLAFMVAYLFLRFGLETKPRRFIFLGAGLMLSGFFLLWWDQTRISVILICLISLVIVVALFYRPKGRERWMAIAAALAIVCALLLWQGPGVILAPFKKASGMLEYLSKAQSNAFPNTGLSIFEQKRLGLQDLVQKTVGNPIPFAIGLLGLGWLFWCQKRKAAALLLLFALGCLSFIFARRFLIFLNPFIALGLGFVAQQAWNLRGRWPLLAKVAPAFAVALCLFPVHNSLGKIYWPKEIPPLVEGMASLNRDTGADAVVWAWWDHGYPIVYWSQRATINDGSLHSGLRTVCNAIPFTARSQREAANFINFYTRRGIRGLAQLFDALGGPEPAMALTKKVLAAGPRQSDAPITQAGLSPPDQWRDFFFPPDQRELYLYLDLRMARTAYWWSWFGTWNVASKDGRHALFRFIRNCRLEGTAIKSRDLQGDLARGRVTYGARTYALSRAIVRDGARLTRTTYDDADGLVLTFDSQARTAAIMDQSFAGSQFTRLYMLSDPDPAYFSLVAGNYPYYQIWKVTADSF